MKSKIFISVFISLIMVSSIIGYMFGDSEESVKYKGYKFVNNNGNWVANINNKQIILSERPDLLEDISVPEIELSYLNFMSKVYLSLNPEDKMEATLYLFAQNVLSNLNPKLIRSCINDSAECKEMPLKSCQDATNNIFVIVIKRGEKSIDYKENCLTITGDAEAIIKYLDKLTLEILT